MGFNQYKKRIEEIEEWLTTELASIHTGRATPAVLDRISVEAYGARVSIKEVAGINIENARTLRITPWDLAQIKSIEKAITTSDLGLSVSVDDKGIRASFPELSSERRDALVKVIKTRLEDARVSLRKEREDAWQSIQKQEKDKVISEDDKFRLKDEMQKITDEANKALEEKIEKKEKEVLGN
ncbi:MAG: ribosome recycling factor [Patescibacteria group bacterium]